MLGGMQFGVLVEVLFCELDGWVLGGMQFGVLVEVLFCELDGWVLGGMQFGVLVEVLFCELDGWAVWGAGGGAVLRARGQFGVLVGLSLLLKFLPLLRQLLIMSLTPATRRCCFASLTAGC